MAAIKCFDVVEMVVEEASRQFTPLFRENAERKGVLKEYCAAIDELAEDFNGESFEVSVDDIKMTISIKLECPDILIQSKEHPFYELVKRSTELHVSHGDGDNLAVEFVFPSIWEKAI